MSKRLNPQSGEWIDRSQTIPFSFEGQTYQAYAGDTISSALWAAGQKVLGRSFKYHRPRGVLSFANHDVNVMLSDGVDTNMRGDVLPVTAHMQLQAVNTQGGVIHDKQSYLDSLSPLLPVGFYYKAFHTPRKLFPFWENIIRKAAGLGVVNFDYPRTSKAKTQQHCDILVIGAGAAGLSAAIRAAHAGLRVVVVDENQQVGGALSYDYAGSDDSTKLLADLLSQIQALPNIKLLNSTYAAGYYTDHLIPLVSEAGLIKMRAKAVIVASGAFEQPIVFRNNDLPGVMLGSAAQRLIARYATKPFERGVVFTANDYGYRVALDLLAAGINVAAVVDMRTGNSALAQAVAEQGVRVLTGHCVYEAVPGSKNMGVKAAIICPYDEKQSQAQTAQTTQIDCDGIVMSAGWAGASALLYQAGSSMRYDYGIEQFVPARLASGVFAAGRVNGVYTQAQKIWDGTRAACEALRYLGFSTETVLASEHKGSSPSHAYPIVPHPKGKNFVDFDEDIQLKDFINAAQEGFDNIELMKRYTTVGMGPSQGKHSNMNAIRILAKIRQLPVEKIGTTTSRPFFHPTELGHLAGRALHPERLTPLHTWHSQTAAVFTQVGAWQRAAYYAKNGLSAQQCIAQETIAVRTGVGIIDISSLGKIELHGADAALFLERFFTGSYADQALNSSRYALMLDEAGVVVDDGLVTRLDTEHYFLSIGTSNAAAVYREMQKALQTWQLQVTLINVTAAMAIINVAGPAAAACLQKLCALDFADAAFPLATAQTTTLAGVQVRLLRVAFVSDTAYEIHVHSTKAMPVWQAVWEAGQAHNITPFGTDAQRLLRLEMGHYLLGIDSDGLSHPFELKAEGALSMQKPYFVGQRSLRILAQKPLKKVLVPFVLTATQIEDMPKECNLVIDKGEIAGRVTSIAYSHNLGCVIGMAYVTPAQQGVGTVFQIKTDAGSLLDARVVSAPFSKE